MADQGDLDGWPKGGLMPVMGIYIEQHRRERRRLLADFVEEVGE
jgi:hypothetical protein